MDVTIEKLIYGGDGLAHHDGATVFVPFVLPGEVVSINPIERKKKFVRGRTERVLTPSPERTAAPCPHFLTCGGCHYQHIPYPAQLRYKEEILRETLRRIGKIDWSGPITVHSASPLNYRNRAQWKVRVIDDAASAEIGYFRAESTALVPIETCPIVSPRLEATLAALRKLIAGGTLPQSLREVEAFADSSDDQILLTLSFAQLPSTAAKIAEAVRAAIPWAASVLLQTVSQVRMELFGPGHIEYKVKNLTYRVSHFSFFQVNRFLTPEMSERSCRRGGSRLAGARFIRRCRLVFSAAGEIVQTRDRRGIQSHRRAGLRGKCRRQSRAIRPIRNPRGRFAGISAPLQRKARLHRARSAARRTLAGRSCANCESRAGAHRLFVLRAFHSGARHRRAHRRGLRSIHNRILRSFPANFPHRDAGETRKAFVIPQSCK